jgi:hypothetical protein
MSTLGFPFSRNLTDVLISLGKGPGAEKELSLKVMKS